MESSYDLLAKGGVLIIPIVLCSVTALALLLERLWALQRTRVIPPRLMRLVLDLLAQDKSSEARTLCASSGSSAAQVAIAGIDRMGRSRDVIREAMVETGRREVALLNRHVGGLGTIAAISPLLGLLGTVSGMIRVFKMVVDEVGARGVVNPGALANGIWEALVTTAAGLSVAIPTYIAYRYLEARIDRASITMEEFASSVVDLLEEATPVTDPTAPDADADSVGTAGAAA